MTRGVKYWNDPDRKYRQDNNVIEEINPKGLQECGPTASTGIIDCMGNLRIDIPKGIQPEDVFSLLFRTKDKEIQQEFFKCRKGVEEYLYRGDGAQIPQFYYFAVRHFFKTECFFVGPHFEIEQYTSDIIIDKCIREKKITFKLVKELFLKGYGIQLCLIDPGHFISGIAFDYTNNEIIYNDPWPGRKGLKNNGLHERMDENEFNKNVNKWCIIYI